MKRKPRWINSPPSGHRPPYRRRLRIMAHLGQGDSRSRLFAKVLLNLAALSTFAAGSARGQVLLDETNLVGLPTVAAPSEYSFTASTAQALTLTLTDFQTPAAFSSLQVA